MDMDHYHEGDMPDMPDMPTSPPGSTAWCTSATAMGNGFTNRPTGPICVLYLFNGWVLNSPVKYGFAVVGTLLWTMGIPYIGYLRRRRIFNGKIRSARTRGLLNFVSYVAQLLLAYAAMLLTMTFSAWIFLAVVSGIAAGHALFSHGEEGKKSGKAGVRPSSRRGGEILAGDETCCADLNGKLISENDSTDSGSVQHSTTTSAEKSPRRSDPRHDARCCDDAEMGRAVFTGEEEEEQEDDDSYGPTGTA